MPFFWRDQFDVKLQMYGIASRGAELQIVEEVALLDALL
jgi:hypothetical protein